MADRSFLSQSFDLEGISVMQQSLTQDAGVIAGSESEVEESSQPQSVAASQSGSTAWSANHPVNLRLSVPLPFLGSYYMTLVAGKERRSKVRLAEERKKHPIATAGNLLFFAAMGTIVGLALLYIIELAALHFLQQSGTVIIQ
jgi:hypothetical protein